MKTDSFRCFVLAAGLSGWTGALLADAPSRLDTSIPGDDQDAIAFNLARLAALEHLAGNGGGAQAEEGSPIIAGYSAKNGFHVMSEDGDWLMRFRGRVQARYTYKGMDPRGDTTEGRDLSAFELERARFGVMGHVFQPWLNYKIEFESASDASDKGALTDAYVYFSDILGEEADGLLNIGIGQWKPYFIRQEKTSSSALQFVDRSIVTEFFNVDRNIGIWADGAMGPLEYEIGVTNGFDSVNETPQEIDHSPAVIVGVDYHVLTPGGKNMRMDESDYRHGDEPAWAIGASFAMDHNNTTATVAQPEFSAYLANVNTAFKYMGMSLQAEYVARWIETDTGTATLPADETLFAHGFYVQGGYFLGDQLEVGARFATIWNDGPSNVDGNSVEVGPVINYFFSGNHTAKLQVDVLYVDIAEMQPPTEALVSNGADFGSFDSSSVNLEEGDQGIMVRAQVQLAW